MSLKQRLRYEKLLHHTRIFNRQYMLTMTNILFHMHKQLYKLKRRTHRMEKIVRQQPPTAQPIIRIPRLTEGLISITFISFIYTQFSCLLDQLSTICINDDANSINEESTVVNTINHDPPMKIKPTKRLCMSFYSFSRQ